MMTSFSMNLAIVAFLLTAIFVVISHGSDAKRLKRYYGGQSAEAGKYSYAVSIAYNDRRRDHVCGGSIIDPDYVLTVAHCVDLVLPSEVFIRSGSVDIRYAISTKVSRIFKHPDFKSTMIGPKDVGPGDIAILKLEKSLDLGDRMNAIRLPTQDRKEVPATFASWGAFSKKPYERSPILQVATVKVISDQRCEERYRPGRRPHYICVHHLTGAPLAGDNGSPLTYGDEIIGLAAAGTGRIGVPSYFINVYHYVDWIKSILSSENDVGI